MYTGKLPFKAVTAIEANFIVIYSKGKYKRMHSSVIVRHPFTACFSLSKLLHTYKLIIHIKYYIYVFI